MIETTNDIKNSFAQELRSLQEDVETLETFTHVYHKFYDLMKEDYNYHNVPFYAECLCACVEYTMKECPDHAEQLERFLEGCGNFHNYRNKGEYLENLDGYYADELEGLIKKLNFKIEDLGGKR